MTVATIKTLLKSNGIDVSAEQIKQKISELGLSVAALNEDSITQVVDALDLMLSFNMLNQW
jgi:hypothetical protein